VLVHSPFAVPVQRARRSIEAPPAQSIVVTGCDVDKFSVFQPIATDVAIQRIRARAATVARSKTHTAMVQRMGWFTSILASASLELSIRRARSLPLRARRIMYGPLGPVLDRFKVRRYRGRSRRLTGRICRAAGGVRHFGYR